MIAFADTSALIKLYIEEPGSENTQTILEKSDGIFVSATAYLESISVLTRARSQKRLSEREHETVLEELEKDFRYFDVVPFDHQIQIISTEAILKHRLKTLDGIQLGSALSAQNRFDLFLCCDKKLLAAADSENLATRDPSLPN